MDEHLREQRIYHGEKRDKSINYLSKARKAGGGCDNTDHDYKSWNHESLNRGLMYHDIICDNPQHLLRLLLWRFLWKILSGRTWLAATKGCNEKDRH